MAKDKYSALWVSHSSINTFRHCPRAYYLANVYKDPATHHKIRVINPPLAMGQVVHEVLEQISVLPAKERFQQSLVLRLDAVWSKITGKRGGFLSVDIEHTYKARAQAMLKTLMDNPGVLIEPAVKIKGDLPYFWLSDQDNIILCGKIDWLQYLPKTTAVHIIDFKTGKREKDEESYQLPIYQLLVSNIQTRPIHGSSYWYLDLGGEIVDCKLPTLEKSYQQIMEIAKKIKLHRQLNKYQCPHQGCNHCLPLERVIKGEGELVGVDEYNNDLYCLLDRETEQTTIVH